MDKITQIPTRYNRRHRERKKDLQLREALSSEVREIPPSEFDRILKEHEEAVVRKAALEMLSLRP